MKNFKCYAHSLNDCSDKISGEHIISKSVLGNFIISEHSGIKRTIGKNSYKVKNLCTNHNSQLGEFENEFKEFTLWNASDADLYQEIIASKEIPTPKDYHIRGSMLEKWLLKTAINYKFYMDGNKRDHFNYKWIVKRLFQDIPFEFPFGLSHFQLAIPLVNKHPGEISFYYHYDNNDIYGITINLQGNIFFICLPTENVHLIIRYGVEFNGEFYLPRMQNPDSESENFGQSTLLWHSGGIRTLQLNANNENVIRSTVHFHWSEETYNNAMNGVQL